MVSWCKRVVILVIVVAGCSFQRSSRDQINSLQAAIDRLLLNFEAKTHIGIEITAVKNGQKLYQKNATQLFIPASSLKLFTAATALATLGSDFQFETIIATDGKIRNEVLEGNLFLKGSGDPEFSLDDLEQLVFKLKLLQIRSITGDIVADNTDFDDISQGPGWMWDDGAEYWNSTIDALTINHNCMKLWVKPAAEIAKPPMVYVYPKTDFVTIQNSALTVEKEGELKVARNNLTKQNLIEVKGSVSLGNSPEEYQVPVKAPQLYAAHLLRNMLAKYQIDLKGGIKVQTAPQTVHLLASHRSAPLSILLQNMLKNSDNLAADCLFKKLGLARFSVPGTWQNGGHAIREFLADQIRMEVSEMVISDGCGLSRYNLASPHQIVTLLIWMQKQFKFAPEFMAALPIAGIDGTLKNRMMDSDLKHKVRAKTGSMTGVSTLSGYATTKDGELLAFSIMINGFVKPAKDYKAQLEDQICTLLTQFSYH